MFFEIIETFYIKNMSIFVVLVINLLMTLEKHRYGGHLEAIRITAHCLKNFNEHVERKR